MGSNGNVQEEYLVRGAYLACEYGTHHRRLNLPWSHGVYIKDKEHCLMNAADCKPGEGQGYNIPPFGICQAPNFPRGGKDTVLLKTETVNPLTGETYRDANGRSIKFEDNVKGCRCEAVFEKNMWQNTHSKTLVCLKGETPYPALTTGSFLYCKYGGHVYPINSGQPMLDPPKADVELLALIQETEIQPELIPLAQGAAGATPVRIPGATISVDGKTINSVYSYSGKVYVDFFEAIRAYEMHTSLKSNYETDGIVKGSIQTSYKYRKVEYTLDLAKGTASYTLYALGRNSITKKELWVAYKNISNVNTSMFFINNAKQSERKYLVEFDYLHQLMCNLGNAEDKTITTNLKGGLPGIQAQINNADVQTKKEYIWNYLTENLGTSDIHTAAIMGNMQQESGFSQTNAQNSDYPGLENPEYIDKYDAYDNVGWGLLQWTFYSRKQELLKYANESGKSIGDITLQLEFLVYEVNNVSPYENRFQQFLRQPDIESATRYFCEKIEEAGTPEMDSRIRYAKSILEEFD
jgi:hypothetical protein